MRVPGALDVVDTRGPLQVVGVSWRSAAGLQAVTGCDWRGRATVERRSVGRRGKGGAGTTGRPVAAAGSREVPVALSGITDEARAKCGNPREAGRHAVAVGVAGDEMVCEQTRYRLVEVTGVQRQIIA
jgi:hypothetical protein